MWLRTVELRHVLRSTLVLFSVIIVNNLAPVFRFWYPHCKLLQRSTFFNRQAGITSTLEKLTLYLQNIMHPYFLCTFLIINYYCIILVSALYFKQRFFFRFAIFVVQSIIRYILSSLKTSFVPGHEREITISRWLPCEYVIRWFK